MDETSSSLGRRVLAALVLVVAGYVLAKLAVGLVTSLAFMVAALIAIVAVIWALRAL